ncbi:MAG: restriction endonuclease subunit S, partial [Muribaculaceae bacterium]|nr:restriction endonuclease subunit S [Muribaculaceae bacterium]
KDKAVTMGHIKRGELDKAKVAVPTRVLFDKINFTMVPIHEQMVLKEIEIRHLSKLRDTLLPKLMSGEIKV